MKKTAAMLLSLVGALGALAGEKPIQDNSFLIEEAYNQEEGVVQHINTFQRFRDSGDWAYTFTQEWPIGGLRHQLSYTIPVLGLVEAQGRHSGIGDVALNYRYQLVGDGDAALALAPRLSVLFPTGDEKRGRGLGAASYQGQLPMSVVLAPALVAHSNAGFTWTPKAKDADGNKADLKAWSVGQSVIWLATARLNLMLEATYARAQEVAGAGRTHTVKAAYVSPGVRWSYDFASGLQIVPGIAFPIGVGPSRHEKSFFLYLSFEHPFKR